MKKGEDIVYKESECTDLRSQIIYVTEQKMVSKSIIERKAYAEAAYFLMDEMHICKHDIFAGKLKRCNHLHMYPTVEEEIVQLSKADKQEGLDFDPMIIAEKIGLLNRVPGAHVVPAYSELVQEGIEGKIQHVKHHMAYCREDSEEQHFYKAEYIVLRAMQERILQYAAEAEKQYKALKGLSEFPSDSQTEGKNLLRIHKGCAWIAYNPPKNFYEAVQLVLLAHEHILAEGGSGSISFGRLDQYLYPFYKKDLYEKKLTKDEAQEMLVAFWQKIAEYESGWQNVTLGGSNSSGEDMCNDLTILCMNASLKVRADQPQMSLRVHKNLPQYIWEKAFELIQTGMGFPELYNDEIAVKAKMNAGVSEEDAWNYSIVGCVEPSAGGKEYSHSEGARFNWAKILELMMNGGRCAVTGIEWRLAEEHSLDEIKDFQEFYEWYKRELIYFTKYLCSSIDILSQNYTNYWPVPVLSSMMQGCIERGKDVTNCGTVYNNLTVNCVGIASVADSLQAIETKVFEEQRISLGELAVAMERNFEGYEGIQEELLECPKYGNDFSSVDNKVKELVELFVDALSETSIKDNRGKLQAGFYTSHFHARMGMRTGALPDGRKKGEALSPSLSPMAGMDKNGPTAVINSAVKIGMEKFSNGMVLDLKMMKDFFRQDKGRKAVQILIEEYFDKGGLEIQFNVLDRKTLQEAQKKPWKYQNLVVRVSGFSAYFVTLDECLQNEIMKRTEHQFA